MAGSRGNRTGALRLPAIQPCGLSGRKSSSTRRFVTEAVSTEVDPAGRLSFAVADLTADDGWDAAMKGVDYVLHVASPLGPASDDPRALIARRTTARCACCGRRPRRAYGVW